MVDADQLHDMVDVIDDIDNGRRVGLADEHADAGDAHHAFPSRERLDCLVGLDAGVVDQGAAIAVSNGDRLLRNGDGIERSAVAAVRNIDQHASGVHRLDNAHPEIADAAVDAVSGARTNAILGIVRQLRTTLAKIVERFDVSRRAEVIGVLKPHDDGATAILLGAHDIGERADASEDMAVARNEVAPDGEEAERLVPRRRASDADRMMDGVYAARTKLGSLAVTEPLAVEFCTELDLDRGEHVDDHALLDEFDRSLRVCPLTPRADWKCRACDVGRCDKACRHTGDRAKSPATCTLHSLQSPFF